MSIQRTFKCSKDVQLVDSSGTLGGVGAGTILSVGQTPGGVKTRTEFEFQADYSSVLAVNKATLAIKVADTSLAPGSAVKFWVEKVTAAFHEGKVADNFSVGATNAEKWPGQASTTTNRVKYEGAPAVGDIIKVDITAMVEASRVAGESQLRVRLIAADATTGYDETNANRYLPIWAREKTSGAGFKPRVEIVGQDHHAPSASADVLPATTNYGAADQSATRVNTSFTITGRFVDTDMDTPKGDSMTASQVQFYDATATDTSAGAITAGTIIPAMSSTELYADGSLDIEHPVFAPDTVLGVEVRGRIRTRDTYGLWGAWTRLAAMRLIPNNRPAAPTRLRVITASDSNPDFAGTHKDPDAGSTCSAVETQVWHQTARGTEVLQNTTSHQPWDSDVGLLTTLNPTGSPDVVGGGTAWRIPSQLSRALVRGQRISRRHRTADQYGAVGAWSDAVSWVVGVGAVPTVTPVPTDKQDSTTPVLGASYGAFIDELYVEAYAANDLQSTQLWASGALTRPGTSSTAAVTYNYDGLGEDLSPGQDLWVRVRVKNHSTSTLSPWSSLSFVWLNALPFAPVVSIEGGVDGAFPYPVVPTQTPRVLAPFSDPDLPDDSVTKQQVRVFLSGGGTPIADTTVTDPTSSHFDLDPLTFETLYAVDVRYADSSGVYGPRSRRVPFLVHRPPTSVVGTTPDPLDPRISLPWVATFYGSAVQAGYRVQVYDVTDGDVGLAYDTGYVADETAAVFRMPPYILEDDHDYEAVITITDSYGVSSQLDGGALVLFATTATLELNVTAALDVTTAPPSDTFTRSVTGGWGTATTGGDYTLTGTAADFNTTGTTGTIAVPTPAAAHRARLADAAYLDITAAIKVKSNKLAVGAAQLAGVLARAVDGSNFYDALLRFNTDATIDLILAKMVGGTSTTLGTFRTAETHVANTNFSVKLNVATNAGALPPGVTLQAKAWLSSNAEPGSYQLTTYDLSSFISTASGVGVTASTASGTTNSPVTFTFDDLTSSSP